MYKDILHHTQEDLHCEHPHLWEFGNWLLHNNNALAYQSLLVGEYLTMNGVTVLPQPPNNSDLVPTKPVPKTGVTVLPVSRLF